MCCLDHGISVFVQNVFDVSYTLFSWSSSATAKWTNFIICSCRKLGVFHSHKMIKSLYFLSLVKLMIQYLLFLMPSFRLSGGVISGLGSQTIVQLWCPIRYLALPPRRLFIYLMVWTMFKNNFFGTCFCFYLLLLLHICISFCFKCKDL